MRNKLILNSSIALTLLGILCSPINNNLDINNQIEIGRRNNSGSSSGSSESTSSGIDGPDTSTYDQDKLNNINLKLQRFVKPGDIYLDSVGAIIKVGLISYQTGHAGVVKSVEYDENGECYITTIEALGQSEGIKEASLTAVRMYNGYIYRYPNLTEEQYSKIIEFSEAQIGKAYDFRLFSTHESIDDSEWYCSELVYAAYKYAGIDLEINSSPYIVPMNIANSSKLKKVIDNDKDTECYFINKNKHVIKCDGSEFYDEHIHENGSNLCRLCKNILMKVSKC